jgi:hypothetical protein
VTTPAEVSAAVAARAQRRIAALERKIGQQQVELEFFSASDATELASEPSSGVPQQKALGEENLLHRGDRQGW